MKIAWNEIETIIPNVNKWYLARFRAGVNQRPTYAPVVAIQWTGSNWFDGSASYRDLSFFDGWADLQYN